MSETHTIEELKELLKRYVHHIGECEGIDFIGDIHGELSKEDRKSLRFIAYGETSLTEDKQ